MGWPTQRRERHQKSDAALKELARVYVRGALKRWDPGVQLASFAGERDGPALTSRVRVREKDVAATMDVSFDRLCPVDVDVDVREVRWLGQHRRQLVELGLDPSRRVRKAAYDAEAETVHGRADASRWACARRARDGRPVHKPRACEVGWVSDDGR